MKRFPLFLLCLLTAALLCTGCSGNKPEGTTPAGTVPGTTANAVLSTAESTQALSFIQSGDLDALALKTAGFSVSRGEMVYLMAVFSSNLYYYGVDTSVSLKDQLYPGGEQTWFDVLAEESVTYARELLEMCEAAKARGYELDQEDIRAVEGIKETALQNASELGWDIDTYFQQVYGTNISWKHMEGILNKTRLAQKVRNEFSDRTYTEAERDEEFQKNLTLYGLIDYYSINLNDGEGISDELQTQTKEAMKKAESLEAFKEALLPFLSAGKSSAEIQDAGGLEAFAQAYLDSALRQGIIYSDSEFFEWAFGDQSKEGEVYLLENETSNTMIAYYLEKKPYKDESPLADVRHILFKVDASNYPTAQEARAKAEEVYQSWLAEGASEEKFIELCAQYSADGNANAGGIYTGVYPGQMVQTFNDWCFDASRKPGDHGIVDTDFGSHMMYFIKSHIQWIDEVENNLLNQALDELIEQQTAATPLEVFQENIDSINW